MPVEPGLSMNELLHLAIADSRKGRHDEAILKLKRCIAADSTHAAAYHLLAAEHAEIGMYAEAVQEFERAIELDSTAVVPRFQLGLLRALGNDPQQAKRDWAPLATMDPEGPWNCFSKAMENLLDEKHTSASRLLDLGLAMPFPNPTLRADMAKLRDRVAEKASASQQEHPAGELLLKSYEKNSPESDG